MSADWETSEPGGAFARAEGRRLLRRARPRLRALVLVGVALAAAFTARRLTAKPPRVGQLVLRIVESDKELTAAARPPREYKDFVWGVFLSGPHLKSVIQRFDLYPDKLKKDPQLAVEAMRDDLDVDVWGNYFDAEYTDPDEARTARVSISWKYKDPDVVVAVIRALGATIIEEQTDERREAFLRGGQDVADAVDRAYDRLSEARAKIARRRVEYARATGIRAAELIVELRDLARLEKELGRRVAEMGKEGSRFEITAALERQRSGILFDLIEPGVLLPRPVGGPLSLVATALGIFGCTLFLGGLLAGAFEVRVRQPDDVRRLGMQVLGAVPRFRGDDAATLAKRLRAADRLRLEGP